MRNQPHPQYPVFVMCGRDLKRRRLLEVLDPEGIYKAKSLLPFIGKRLIDWQIEELRQSPYVEGLYLIGLTEEDAAFDFPVHYVPVETTADIADKFSAGMAYLVDQGKLPEIIIISSSDTPGIQLEDINAFFQQLEKWKDYDFVQSLVPEDVIEAVFPKSARVVARFKDCQVIPGELYALSPRAIRIGREAISQFGQRRRKINRQGRNISLGPMLSYIARRPQAWSLIIKYALGTATLADAEKGFTAAFDCKTKGIIIASASFGMDMDLPEDYKRLEQFVQMTKCTDFSK